MGWRWRHSLIWVGSFLILMRSPWFIPSDSPRKYKCVNGSTSEGSWVMYSGLRLLPLEADCINVVEEWLSLKGEIVRYSSVSLSPTLGRNEKVEQHIRKKTCKPNALRFWVEGDVIPLYRLAHFSFLRDLPGYDPSDSSNTYRRRSHVIILFLNMKLESVRPNLICLVSSTLS